VCPLTVTRAFRGLPECGSSTTRPSSRARRRREEARATQLDARSTVMFGARATTSTVRVNADAGKAHGRDTMKIARAPGRVATVRGRREARGARATRGARVVASAAGAKIKVIGCGGGGGNAVNRMIQSGLQVRQRDRRVNAAARRRRETRARTTVVDESCARGGR